MQKVQPPMFNHRSLSIYSAHPGFCGNIWQNGSKNWLVNFAGSSNWASPPNPDVGSPVTPPGSEAILEHVLKHAPSHNLWDTNTSHQITFDFWLDVSESKGVGSAWVFKPAGSWQRVIIALIPVDSWQKHYQLNPVSVNPISRQLR